MQKTDIENIINEIKEELKQKYSDFRGLYLFGSRARGDFNENSDYDIALIFEREINWSFKKNIQCLMYDFMLKYDIVIDNPIFQYNQLLQPDSFLAEKIYSEGIFYG